MRFRSWIQQSLKKTMRREDGTIQCKYWGGAVEDLKRIAFEQQALYFALLKNMPNNKQLTYKYEITQKRNAAIFERLEKVFTLFEHVEKRTEAFRELNEANKLKDQSQALHYLEVISKHHEHIDKLNQ